MLGLAVFVTNFLLGSVAGCWTSCSLSRMLLLAGWLEPGILIALHGLHLWCKSSTGFQSVRLKFKTSFLMFKCLCGLVLVYLIDYCLQALMIILIIIWKFILAKWLRYCVQWTQYSICLKVVSYPCTNCLLPAFDDA